MSEYGDSIQLTVQEIGVNALHRDFYEEAFGLLTSLEVGFDSLIQNFDGFMSIFDQFLVEVSYRLSRSIQQEVLSLLEHGQHNTLDFEF